GTHDSDANTHVVSVPWLPAGNIGRMEVIRVKSAESLFHTGFERRGKSSKAHGGRPRDSRAGLRTFLRSRRARTGRFPLAGPYAVAFADRHGGLAVARGAGQPDTDVGGRLSGLAAQHSLEVGAF